MKIDRSNYEVWLIDYLDGNLDDDHLVLLKDFLNENPDIEQEMNFFEQIRTIPEEKTYPFKTSLIKNPSDLSDDQFSYLCIAYAENDLSEPQSAELLEIIAENPSKQKTFNIINRLKLKPDETRYPNKDKLIKQAPRAVPIGRIVLAGLSIAASIAIFFFVFYNPGEEKPSVAVTISKTENQVQGKLDENKNVAPVSLLQQTENKSIPDKGTNISPSPTDNIPQLLIAATESGKEDNLVLKDSIITRLAVPGTSYFTSLSLATPVKGGSLLPVSYTTGYQAVFKEPGGLKNYLTTLLRKNVFKDEISETGPLKGYEIADAGINGINKILGWDMSFEKMTDKNGDLSSLCFQFASLVKFNAPVKKFISDQ